MANDAPLTPLLSPAARSNQDFIQKAAMTVATFSPGGLLLPQQVMQFVELAIVESDLLKDCNTTIIPTSTYEIDKIGFTGQVLLPDEEDVAFGFDDVATPTTDKIQYVTKRYKAEIGLTYDTVKRVIDGDRLMPYLIQLLSKAAMRDLEIAAIQGDSSLSPTSKLNRLLSKQDGYLKQVQTNVVDAAGSRLSLDMLDSARRQMPDEYYDQENLNFLVTKNVKIDYEAAVAARATQLGDQSFTTQNTVKYRGEHAVRTAKLLPKTLVYNGQAVHTNIIFGNTREHFLVGFLEEMSIRTAEDIRAGKFIAVLRFDVSFKIKHEPAVVRIANVRNQP